VGVVELRAEECPGGNIAVAESAVSFVVCL
jgi:hypothetical protein